MFNVAVQTHVRYTGTYVSSAARVGAVSVHVHVAKVQKGWR